MNLEKIIDIITQNDNEALRQYLTAAHGERIGIYVDGSFSVGRDVGREIEPIERPIFELKCSGINNLDMTWWREGWDCDHLTDEEVIAECCKNGDLIDEAKSLAKNLMFDDQEARAQ
jgi:hypothetical protein